MNKIASVIFIFSIISTTLNSQISSPEIDKLVENALLKFNVAGTSVAIVKDDKIVHKKGYGVKSLETKLPVDENTNFGIASNSKAFTAVALALLVEDGKIKWEDKVIQHIPEFKMYNDYVTQNFNIQDLLTHRSGLGLGIGDLMLFPDSSNFTIDDILSSFQYFKPSSAFRTKFDYDNLLYIVAGELIARVSGASWESFVQERILNPLKMDHSFSSLKGMNDKSNLSSPHSTFSGTLKTIPESEEMINGAAGGIISNVDDLCVWMLLHLNKGKYGENLEKQLFTEESLREMWRIHTPLTAKNEPRYNTHFSGYGLGWFLKDMNGKLCVTHTGYVAGMLSITLMIPDINLGIIVLTNTEMGGSDVFQAVSKTILDSYLKLPYFDWTADIYTKSQANKNDDSDKVKEVWNTVEKNKKIELKKLDYIGTYQDVWFGEIEIYEHENQLWFKSLRSPLLTGPMAFYNEEKGRETTFAIKWKTPDLGADAFAVFTFNKNGKVENIKMKGISEDIDFSYDFQDLLFTKTPKKD